MDLGAYANIPTLEKIAEEHNIKVNRVRGYRLMKDEEPITKEEINEQIEDILIYWLEYESKATHIFGFTTYQGYEDDKRYIKKVGNKSIILWENIHGKLRKKLKFAKKNITKRVNTQWNLWNNYCGKDVLYIHAKQGSTNWSDTTHESYAHDEWYLNSCDDAFDSCYCDIYAKI